MSKSKIERLLSVADPAVAKNVEIVTPQTLGYSQLLHFSIDPNIRNFIPQVSRRTAKKEDRSLPRVSTSTQLAGAILAYQALQWDFEDERHKKGFRGGWYIYGFDFDYALKPNNRILYDAKATDEIWLVPYEAAGWEMKAQKIGKFFPIEFTLRYLGNKVPSTKVVFVMHVTGESVQITHDKALAKGYHHFTLENIDPGYNFKEVVFKDHSEISKKEYDQLKKTHASMLDYEAGQASSKW